MSFISAASETLSKNQTAWSSSSILCRAVAGMMTRVPALTKRSMIFFSRRLVVFWASLILSTSLSPSS